VPGPPTGAFEALDAEPGGTRGGKPMRPHAHYFLTTVRTTPKALLQLVRDR
jgi:hypothetical protein